MILLDDRSIEKLRELVRWYEVTNGKRIPFPKPDELANTIVPFELTAEPTNDGKQWTAKGKQIYWNENTGYAVNNDINDTEADVYFPTAQEPDYTIGDRIFCIYRGRWEMVGGGAGGDVKIYGRIISAIRRWDLYGKPLPDDYWAGDDEEIDDWLENYCGRIKLSNESGEKYTTTYPYYHKCYLPEIANGNYDKEKPEINHYGGYKNVGNPEIIIPGDKSYSLEIIWKYRTPQSRQYTKPPDPLPENYEPENNPDYDADAPEYSFVYEIIGHDGMYSSTLDAEIDGGSGENGYWSTFTLDWTEQYKEAPTEEEATVDVYYDELHADQYYPEGMGITTEREHFGAYKNRLTLINTNCPLYDDDKSAEEGSE